MHLDKCCTLFFIALCHSFATNKWPPNPFGGVALINLQHFACFCVLLTRKGYPIRLRKCSLIRLNIVLNSGSSLFSVGNLVRRVLPWVALRYACSRSNPTYSAKKIQKERKR